MKKMAIIAITVIFVVSGGLLAWYMLHKDSPEPPKSIVSRQSIVRAIAQEANSGSKPIVKAERLVVQDIAYIDNWIMAYILNMDAPIDSDARFITYIIKSENDTLTIVTASTDGFDEASFPEGTPKNIIEKATAPWQDSEE